MSKFRELKQELEELKCTHCHGGGQKDDAEPGDIFCRTWTCPVCEGTGINPLYTVSLYVGVKK